MADNSTTDYVISDTVVDVPVISYSTWREPKTYFPYGKGIKQTILQQFGPVLGALVFIALLEKGRILQIVNRHRYARSDPGKYSTVTVDQSQVIIENEPSTPKNKSSTASSTQSVKKTFTAYVNGKLTTFEYDEPVKKKRVRSIVSSGKKAAVAVWNSTTDGAKWLINRTRQILQSNGKTVTGKELKKGSAGMTGLVISALSYIDALSQLFVEVGTGSPTLIWHGEEDCRIQLLYQDENDKKVFNEPYYITKITVADLAILAHYAYTGAIGGNLGYSLTQTWNSVGADLTLLPDMTLTLAVLPGTKKQWKDGSGITTECKKLHEKWVKIHNDVSATAATFGNIAGFVPILVSIFAGKLGSTGKTVRAVILLLLSEQIDNFTSKTTESLEALIQ